MKIRKTIGILLIALTIATASVSTVSAGAWGGISGTTWDNAGSKDKFTSPGTGLTFSGLWGGFGNWYNSNGWSRYDWWKHW